MIHLMIKGCWVTKHNGKMSVNGSTIVVLRGGNLKKNLLLHLVFLLVLNILQNLISIFALCFKCANS